MLLLAKEGASYYLAEGLDGDLAGDFAGALDGLFWQGVTLIWTKIEEGERLEPSSLSSRTWR